MNNIIWIVGYIVLAPFIGGLLDGIDRKISARMQGRKGPSVLQPFYDVKKLFTKEFLTANKNQLFMLLAYLVFVILTGAIFFGGYDVLLCVFALSTAEMFLILATTSTHTLYTSIGAQRELAQMMAYEPMMLLTAIAFYLVTGSFNVAEIASYDTSVIAYAPAIFAGFLFILTIKLRKSPFDLSTSHHANQEVIKGVTSEMVGPAYGLIEVAEWYELVYLLGMIALFVINSNPVSYIVAAVVVALAYFLEILIDNTSARVKWQLMVKLAWGVALFAGGINLLILVVVR